MQDRIAAGLAPDRAAEAAIMQFGSLRAVADAFAGELTPRTRAALSPISLRPARWWESGGCSCFSQVLGAPA
jgi:hypothetical protein